MKAIPADDSSPEFKLGEHVLVTGGSIQAGQHGTIIGFYRGDETHYVVKFDNGSWADLPHANLQAYPKI